MYKNERKGTSQLNRVSIPQQLEALSAIATRVTLWETPYAVHRIASVGGEAEGGLYQRRGGVAYSTP